MISKGTTQCLASDMCALDECITYFRGNIDLAISEGADEEAVRELIRQIADNYDNEAFDLYEAFVLLREAGII